MFLRSLIPVCWILLFVIGCQSSETTHSSTNSLFTLLSPQESGLYFINEVNENEKINILTYEYLYNGGGVAIGDINNDGLPDVFMTGNLFGGRLFLNKGNMKFEQISEKANVFYGGFTTGVTMVDINQDGWLDIYLCRSLDLHPENRANLLLINNRDNTFSERAKEYGLADTGYSNHANFFDYDRDGDLDLFLLNHRVDFESALTLYTTTNASGKKTLVAPQTNPATQSKLYQNNGNGSFTDVSKKAGIAQSTFGLSCSVADINRDGWPDIYVANDYGDKDFFYINNQKGGFSDELNRMFRHISKNAMGNDIADFNNDGWLDLMNLDMVAEDNYRQKQLKGNSPYDKYFLAVGLGLHHQVVRNTLQLNNGLNANGLPEFSEIAQLAGVSHTDWSWSPLFADFDNDGWKDLFVTNGYARDVADLDYFRYYSVEALQKAGNAKKINPLELLKLMTSTPLTNYAFRNTHGLRFENKSAEWGINLPSFSNGAAYADLDADGDLDLVINNYNSEAFLYQNNSRLHNKNHYLQVKLHGTPLNPTGIGAQVTLVTDEGQQTQLVASTRGFLSSTSTPLHFGLGTTTAIKELKVTWPDGTTQNISKPPVDQLVVLAQKEAQPAISRSFSPKFIFKKASLTPLDTYTHLENNYIDFKDEPLLEHLYSNKGPYTAQADVNQDGLEDLFIGGAAGQSGTLFLQQQKGSFKKSVQPAFEKDAAYEDAGAQFFDADGDKDLDLWVNSGGYQQERSSPLYRHRLYLNDGKGQFALVPQPFASNATCVKAQDLDLDGDQDLFIGGGVTPHSYPLFEKSFLLLNDQGSFRDASHLLPNGGKLGIVNDALWADLDHDRFPDLVIVGEWMPITMLKNSSRQFLDITSKAQLAQSNGWWNCIEGADFDQDGDVDFVVGNRGENSFFRATPAQPARLYAGDYDQNGRLDAIPCYYFKDGRAYPKHSLDELANQVPLIKKKMTRYATYSKASIEDIIGAKEVNAAEKRFAHTFSSSYLQNNGNLTFGLTPLPVEAQFSTVQSMLVGDFNADKHPDVLLCGNDHGSDVDSGRQDASLGLLLLGNGKGDFTSVPAHRSGLYLEGDYRRVIRLKVVENPFFYFFLKNNGRGEIMQ